MDGQQGTVFVIGDATHVHSPAGSQVSCRRHATAPLNLITVNYGGNSSIQDPFNLAWKITLICQGYSSSSLLESYNEKHLLVIAQMLSLNMTIHKTLGIFTHDSSQFEGRENLMQLGINYWGSSILVDEWNARGSESDGNVDFTPLVGLSELGIVLLMLLD